MENTNQQVRLGRKTDDINCQRSSRMAQTSAIVTLAMIGDSVWRLGGGYNVNTERMDWNRKNRRPFHSYNLKENEYGIVNRDEHFENRWEYKNDRQHMARTWKIVRMEGREEGITFRRQFGMYQDRQQMTITWNRVQRKEEFECMGKGRRNNIEDSQEG